MRCWCGYLSGARCTLFAYGPADATAIPELRHLLLLALFKSRPVLSFWYRLTQVVPEKRPLNGCSGSSTYDILTFATKPYVICFFLTFSLVFVLTSLAWLQLSESQFQNAGTLMLKAVPIIELMTDELQLTCSFQKIVVTVSLK